MKHGGAATRRQILPAIFFISLSLSSQPSWGEPADRIPFRLEKGHILVTASLNDAEGLTFAVDTGTTYTMID